MADLTPAKAGDKISKKAQAVLAKHHQPQEAVAAKTPDTKYGGQWFCIDCGAFPQNNLYAWNHAGEHPKHRFAWRNADNGGTIEEP